MISRIEATREITWGYKIYRVECCAVLDTFPRYRERGNTGIAIYTTLSESLYRWKAKGIYKIGDLEKEGLAEYKEELEKRNAHYFARLVSQDAESEKSVICFVEDGLAKALLDAIEENQKELETHIDCETEYYKKWRKEAKAEAIGEQFLWPIFVEDQKEIIMM